jgi:hypothetical protein
METKKLKGTFEVEVPSMVLDSELKEKIQRVLGHLKAEGTTPSVYVGSDDQPPH